MKVKKNKIKFIDLKKYGFAVEPKYYWWGWSKSPKILGRESLVKALVKAKKFLPTKWNFKVWDCRRPRQVNELMIKSFFRRIKQVNPRLSAKETKKLVIKFAGPVPSLKRDKNLWTHYNGGAIDLTLVDEKGNEVYMGTEHDDLTKKATLRYFENKKNLSVLNKIAKNNRRILSRAMRKSGFEEYRYEWWHWWFEK